MFTMYSQKFNYRRAQFFKMKFKHNMNKLVTCPKVKFSQLPTPCQEKLELYQILSFKHSIILTTVHFQ